MRLVILLGFSALLTSGRLQAQESWETWQVDTKASASVVFSPHMDDAFDRAGETTLYRALFRIDADRVLDSGLEIGSRLSVELQKDHPARPGFAEALGDTFFVSTPQGAYSGSSSGGSGYKKGARGQVETAFVYAKGGYGEVRIGRDRGVAARFHEGAPSVFETARLDTPSLDPSGRGYIRTNHDLTGPSAKVSGTTARILGVRAGVSFTPTSEAAGLDRNVGVRGAGVDQIEINNATEIALNVSRRLQESGVRLRGGLAASRGDVDPRIVSAQEYGSVETYSAGMSAEFETIIIGASGLISNNGLRKGEGDYSAWSVGITKTFGEIILGADYGEADDESAGIYSNAWTLGVSKAFNTHISGAIGYRAADTRLKPLLSPSNRNETDTIEGIVVEITLSL